MNFDRFQFASRRSNALSFNGMVATSQPLAVQAGLEILKAGGNAVDAAIATTAVLCVVEPCSTGIGGDAFALIWWADDGLLYGLNASGPAPLDLTAEHIAAHGHNKMPERGALAVTVPGSVGGWQAALDRFGSLSLEKVLSKAGYYARNGFPVSQRIAQAWSHSVDLLQDHPDSRRVWLPGGRSPRAGEPFRNPELAKTLNIIAKKGCEAFYTGRIGQQISTCVQDLGGLLSVDDLASYQPEWIEPLSVAYRGDFKFHELPPNGQGLTALLALNIAQGFDLLSMGYGSPDFWHVLIEAIKLAFADAAAYIGDPRQVRLPLSGLMSREYAAKRRALIDMDRALIPAPGLPSAAGDTVYLTVVDDRGNMVSWIQSLYMDFGCGLTAGTTGVQLQNRGANFTLEDGHPNQVAPGKRPYHTIIPGFITHRNEPWCSFGVMGGFMQPQGHLQVGVSLVDFAMDPQAALDAPRFRWLGDRSVALEASFPETIAQELSKRGHDIVTGDEARFVGFGGGQIIVRDPKSGLLIGGSDPRKDGSAAGW
jgi:gamma-glutamyltranspeptidase/glutathione hydrolase